MEKSINTKSNKRERERGVEDEAMNYLLYAKKL